ncbi:RTA1-domain-containing protein [Gloeophyllum trabeum ATCC 11539]|uniref:RTA1-domain-containing protein n=1 Tax=Gloeophyllum trabeum (strain ATCC 11539 / FP-39264 / Madison 617) TaxID=670483 RepID=S7RHH0_GLOTA|nr:RTA1-domain-containing protein [Gloeophyllum trabeum ATCC 11539]EPQ52029.1 RTA1-domain-containing protein [Gloeophyllum trabeum ATCC 11539]
MSATATTPLIPTYTPSTTAGLSPAEIDYVSSYHYVPTQWICILFVVLFSISFVLHVAQALYYRMWWLFITVIPGTAGEVIGWAGRLWSFYNLLNQVPFKMQLVSLVIAPTPLLAAVFVLLGRLIARLGPQYSRLPPRWYTIVFVSCDVISLLLQAAGGARAASAYSIESIHQGSNILLAGIAFQLGAMSIFLLLATEFGLNYLLARPVRHTSTKRGALDARLAWLAVGVGLSTLFLYVRAIYRTIELADGWLGHVIRVQAYFDGMDGAMVVLAVWTLNFLHPGFLLREPVDAKGWDGEKGVGVTKA